MESFMKEEVKRDIINLKENKAPIADNITAEIIKAGGETLKNKQHTLCNKIYTAKCAQKNGKAIIIPRYKKNEKLNAARLF